jgi:cation diffusion facilitator CzcD-associated flavoprotein CzcO
MTEHVRVAVVGGGFSGIGAAALLKSDGVDDLLVLERAGDLGGTWRDNTYPGCACDVPSHLYSFSFARNPGWSRSYSAQPEIHDYLRDTARRHGLLPHVRLRTEVTGAAWDAGRRHWRIDTQHGPLTADVLVSAAGPLCEPAVPALPGLSTFAGTVFHSARWRHDHDLTGRRVAVIGTGASAAQFVPYVAARAAHLDVYQRTPPWVMPRGDRDLRHQRLHRTVPGVSQLARGWVRLRRDAAFVVFRHPRLARLAERIARRHLARQVPDPALRARLTPDYALGCKRVVVSDDYLPALSRPDVTVVTDGIGEVRPDAVVAVDGTVRPVDTIVFGTGFRVSDPPFAERIRGVDGRSLAGVWQGSPQAHLGTTVAGFPNLFLLLGPNTGLGHTSVLLMLEAQLRHVRSALAYLRRTGAAALAPTPAAQRAWVAEVDRKTRGTVWAAGCMSWYLDGTGRNSALWPRGTWAFRRRVAPFRPADYEISRSGSVLDEPSEAETG